MAQVDAVRSSDHTFGALCSTYSFGIIPKSNPLSDNLAGNYRIGALDWVSKACEQSAKKANRLQPEVRRDHFGIGKFCHGEPGR